MATTYTSGYKLILENDITTLDILNVCKVLTELFNQTYHTNQYLFEPEGVSEGGIVFVNFPGKKEKQYKTMRIAFGHKGKWPWVDLEKWRESPKTIMSQGGIVTTCLKAFHEAPLWTLEELRLFETCLLEVGLKRKGVYPKKKDLKSNTTEL